MRILVIGAGALGGYFGARLQAAGRDVTFLVRETRVERLHREGLRVRSPQGNVDLATVRTVTEKTLDGAYGLVLLTCKQQDLAGAIEALAPAVGEETAILPLLNGMRHMRALDERFGTEHVLGGVSIISATRDEDGTIRHLNTLDRLYFGDRAEPRSERMAAVEQVLVGAGFAAERRDRIEQDMWNKWVSIATSAGITCLMRATVGDLVAAGASGLATQLMDENAAVARAAGFPVPEAALAATREIVTEAGSGFTASMLRDLEAGAPIEAGAIVGDLLEVGREKGVSAPLLRVVYAHLRSYEERRARETRQ